MTRPTTPFDRVTAADNAINGAQQMRADLAYAITLRCTCEHNAGLVAQHAKTDDELARLESERAVAQATWLAAEFGESA